MGSKNEPASISPLTSPSRKGGVYAGPSRGTGGSPDADKPSKEMASTIFKPGGTRRTIGGSIAAWRARKLMRQEVPCVDPELLGRLLRKFAFVPRTPTALGAMSREAQAYFKGFDCSEWTELELYRATVMTITAAMDIPEEEELCRQHLKSEGQEKAREAHAKMMKGQLGNTRSIFGIARSAVLPGIGSG